MVAVAFLMGLASLLLPAAGGPLVVLVPILVAAWPPRGLALPVFNIPLASLRQAMTPDALQGRVNATSRVLAGAAAPAGGPLGGVVGGRLGVAAGLSRWGLGAGPGCCLRRLSPRRGNAQAPRPRPTPPAFSTY